MSGTRPASRYVVASVVSWHRGLAERLAARSGAPFSMVTDPAALEPALDASVRYIFFTHWSTRIPESVWARYEAIVLHMTDVPYGRGGSPLQNLIVRGHRNTKISALRCVDALDAGPVYLKRDLSLDGSATEIFARATDLMEQMIADIVMREPEPVPQTGEPVLFKRRLPAESRLTEEMTLAQVFDHIRMLDAEGYPHAFIELGPLRLEFTRARHVDNEVRAAVTIRRGEHS